MIIIIQADVNLVLLLLSSEVLDHSWKDQQALRLILQMKFSDLSPFRIAILFTTLNLIENEYM